MWDGFTPVAKFELALLKTRLEGRISAVNTEDDYGKGRLSGFEVALEMVQEVLDRYGGDLDD